MNDAFFFISEILPIFLPELSAKSTPWISKFSAQKLSCRSTPPSAGARMMIFLLSKRSTKLSRNQTTLLESKRFKENFMNIKKPPRQKLKQKAGRPLQKGRHISFVFLMTAPRRATSSRRLQSSVHKETSHFCDVFWRCGGVAFGPRPSISVNSVHRVLPRVLLHFLPSPSLFRYFHFLTFSPPFLLIPPQCVHLFPPFNSPFFSFSVFSAGSHSSVFGRFAPLCLWAFVCGKGDRVAVREDTLICVPSGQGPGFLPGAGESRFAVGV